MKRRFLRRSACVPPCGCGDGRFAVGRAAFGMSWESKLVEPKPAHVEIRNLQVRDEGPKPSPEMKSETKSETKSDPSQSQPSKPAFILRGARASLAALVPVGGALESAERGDSAAELHPGRLVVFAGGRSSRGYFVGHRYRRVGRRLHRHRRSELPGDTVYFHGSSCLHGESRDGKRPRQRIGHDHHPARHDHDCLRHHHHRHRTFDPADRHHAGADRHRAGHRSPVHHLRNQSRDAHLRARRQRRSRDHHR